MKPLNIIISLFITFFSLLVTASSVPLFEKWLVPTAMKADQLVVAYPLGISLSFFSLVLLCKLLGNDYYTSLFAYPKCKLKSLLFWLGIMLFASFFVILLAFLFPDLAFHAFEQQVYAHSHHVLFLSLSIILLSPGYEEFIFRGFLFEQCIENGLKIEWTIILTSLLWAMIHTQYPTAIKIIIFSLGIILGLARIKTKSILTPILLHMVFNASQLLYYLFH